MNNPTKFNNFSVYKRL